MSIDNHISNRNFSEWYESTGMLELASQVSDIYHETSDWDVISQDDIGELFPTAEFFASEDGIYLLLEEVFAHVQNGAHVSTINAHGAKSAIADFFNVLETKFQRIKSKISWVYGEYGESTQLKVANRPVIRSAYPHIENLENYFDDFAASPANALILIGPPGTGKTTFIRGLLNHCNFSATVTFESQLLTKDSFFADFISGKSNILIMEDADVFLSARTDGNSMMHKFLNMSDGLISSSGKKIVFSTNLPSIKSVDEALIRPGRCFDVLEFSKLTKEQAEKVAEEAGIEYNGGLTIAEIFAPVNPNLKTKKGIGF